MNYLSIINNANHKYQIKDPELNKTKHKTKTVEKKLNGNSSQTLQRLQGEGVLFCMKEGWFQIQNKIKF